MVTAGTGFYGCRGDLHLSRPSEHNELNQYKMVYYRV